MEEETMGFAPKPREDCFKKEYQNQYVVISSANGSVHVGRVMEVNDDWLILNPYQGNNYTQSPPREILINQPERISRKMINDGSIKTVSEENLMAHLNFINSERIKTKIIIP